MRKRAIATLALGGLLSSTATTTAHAESLKSGVRCGFASVADPTAEPNVQTADVEGGPVVIVDDTDPSIVHTGHLTCTIQVGVAGTHAGADAAAVSGPDTPLVVNVPPTRVTYSATWDQNVYLCASVTTDEGTWYYDDPNDPLADGSWSTSNAVDCRLALGGGTVPPEPDCEHDPFCLDRWVCQVARLLPPGVPGVVDVDTDGDVTVLGIPFWDCPPYGT